MNNTENNQGWIKLHRRLLDNAICDNPKYLSVWICLLLMANHKDKEFIWNNKKIIIKEGQLLTGLKVLSKKTGVAQGTVYRILKYLENEKQIEQQKTTKFTIISIVNWDKYQQSEKQSEKQIENRLKTNGKQIETNKNDKNDKNIIPKGKEQVQVDNRDQRIDELMGLIHKELGVKLIGKYQKERLIYSNAIKLLTRRDSSGNIKKGREWLSDDWKLNFRNFINKLAVSNPKVISNIQWADTLYKQLKFYIENHGQF